MPHLHDSVQHGIGIYRDERPFPLARGDRVQAIDGHLTAGLASIGPQGAPRGKVVHRSKERGRLVNGQLFGFDFPSSVGDGGEQLYYQAVALAQDVEAHGRGEGVAEAQVNAGVGDCGVEAGAGIADGPEMPVPLLNIHPRAERGAVERGGKLADAAADREGKFTVVADGARR